MPDVHVCLLSEQPSPTYARSSRSGLPITRQCCSSAQARDGCNGLWLEDYVAGIVQRLHGSGPHIQEAARSVEVRYVGAGRERGKPAEAEHEVDAIIRANNLVHLLECKTRLPR